MKSITDDILEWSEKYIEPKNEHLGVSVCPYAKRARLENKYKILEWHNFAHFQDTIIEGAKLAKDPDTQIVIVGCDDIGYEPEQLSSVIDILNRILVPKDIYLMGSHPWDDEEEEPQLDEKNFTEIDFEGVDYLEDEDSGEIYSTSHELVGKWTEDCDDIIWSNESFRLSHESIKD